MPQPRASRRPKGWLVLALVALAAGVLVGPAVAQESEDTEPASTTIPLQESVDTAETTPDPSVAPPGDAEAPATTSTEASVPAGDESTTGPRTTTPLAGPAVDHVEAFADPTTVTPEGGTVTFAIGVNIHPSDLPATVVDVSAVVEGDVAELVNPTADDCPGSCCTPVEVLPDSPSFGAYGWGCEFTAFVLGPPGPVPVTIAATIVGGDGSATVAADTVVITVSEGLGAIHGVLLDAATGQLLDEEVYVIADPSGVGAFSNQAVFALEGLPPGEYRLGTGNGVLSTSTYAFEWYDDAVDPTAATPVVVEAGRVTRIEWGLSVGGAIEGTVIDAATGSPVPKVRVAARHGGTGTSTGLEYTDADGRFRLSGLTAGPYVVTANWGEWAAERGPVDVALGQVAAGVDFAIGQAAPPTTQPPVTQPTLPNTGVPGTASTGWAAALAMLAAGAALVLTTRRRSTAQ